MHLRRALAGSIWAWTHYDSKWMRLHDARQQRRFRFVEYKHMAHARCNYTLCTLYGTSVCNRVYSIIYWPSRYMRKQASTFLVLLCLLHAYDIRIIIALTSNSSIVVFSDSAFLMYFAYKYIPRCRVCTAHTYREFSFVTLLLRDLCIENGTLQGVWAQFLALKSE